MVGFILLASPDFDQETEDSRRKMIDSDLITILLIGLLEKNADVRQSALNVISQHGKFAAGDGSGD